MVPTYSRGDADLLAATLSCSRVCDATCEINTSFCPRKQGRNPNAEFLGTAIGPPDRRCSEVARWHDRCRQDRDPSDVCARFGSYLAQAWRFQSNCTRFPAELIAVVVYPPNGLEEERAPDYTQRIPYPTYWEPGAQATALGKTGLNNSHHHKHTQISNN